MVTKQLTQSTHSSLVEVLRHWVDVQPQESVYTFLLDGDSGEAHLTFAELDQRARAVAAQLQRTNKGGERAILLYPPGLEFIVAFLGCLYSGIIAVPAYPPHPTRLERSLPRLRAIINDAQPSIVLTTEVIQSTAQKILLHLPDISPMQWMATDIVDSSIAEDWNDPHILPTACAFLQYTSGSTATPKGVVVTHANLMHNQRMIQEAFRHDDRTVHVAWLPLYHDMGLIGNVLQSLYLGTHCVLIAPTTFLQRPFRWLQAISQYRATTSGGPNFAYDLCVRRVSPEQRADLNLNSWTIAFNGAEPIRHDTIERFTRTFEECGFHREAFYPCYGLAEATLFVTGATHQTGAVTRYVDRQRLSHHQVIMVDPTHEQAMPLVSSGRNWSEQQIVIVDPDTHTCCVPDQVGEIWIAGDSVAQGYWQRPTETTQTFHAHTAENGNTPFLRTGDLGFVHDDEFFITGRIKDLIIVDGVNHYPQDIELTVEQCHPAIRSGSCAAFAVDVDGQEKLVVVAELDREFRTLRKRSEPAVMNAETPAQIFEELVITIRRVVSEQHDMHLYDFQLLNIGAVSKTSSGKIQRHACRESYLDQSLDVFQVR
ncbi:MAG: fatty acyl-AMP ligase [Chloroflexota bacterium]